MVQKDGIKNKIIIISGPTASGKTALSVKLAKELNGEIIGCDSMQIYQGLDIGTGKVSKEIRQEIPHFMIDIIPPNAEYSVSEYATQCEQIIKDITSRGKTPIITGGTGLYISGLLFGFDYCKTAKSDVVREKYKKILAEKGKDFLFEILKKIDPPESEKISPNDTKRVIRAIEIYELTGKPKSTQVNEKKSKYNYKLLVLSPPRDKLYSDINRRVDKMIEDGLLDEVKSLYELKDCQSMQAIGYKELISYLNGEITFSEAVEAIKINSRHYAKRQLTYLKNMKACTKIINNYSNQDDKTIIKELKEFISEEL